MALGETSATAYRGDRGKIAYDHSQITGANPHGITPGIIGAAAASHNHNASAINAGTLPIARGGTGAGDAATARTNLGITPANIGAAASSHNHAASNITSGTFTVARGGTGRATLTAGAFLRGNGTSAVTMSTAAQVRTDLGVPNIQVSSSQPTNQAANDLWFKPL